MARLGLSEQARAFAREVGSIVLGVLIALGIGEVADDLRWRSRAATTNAAIDLELSYTAGALDARVMMQPCIDRRLRQIDELITTAQRTGRLPDVQPIGGLLLVSLRTTAWDDAVSGGAFLHLSNERRVFLSTIYPVLKTHYEDMLRESRYWATLKMVQGRPGKISETMLTEVALAAAQIKLDNYIAGQGAQQMLAMINAAGIKPKYDFVSDHAAATRAEVVPTIASLPICRESLLQS